MVEKTIESINVAGLYAKSAALFVQTAGKFKSKVWISKGGIKVNAKSIMGIMSLAAFQGTSIVIGAEGEDEEQVLKELGELINSGFAEYKA
ncbi:MAG: crh1 [Clostridiales bacterium]|jgi:phosphocarrier protein|nr:crh1 [Clostridiales bacterium]